MTITYQDSKRISGLSTDTVPSATYSTDFSTNTGWTKTGTKIQVNTTTQVLDIDVIRDGSNYATSYDLGAGGVSDTAWVLRWKERYTTITTGSSVPNHMVGIFDSNDTVGGRSNQACIEFRPYQTSPTSTDNGIYAIWCNTTGSPMLSPTGNNKFATYVATTNTNYYYEIRRTSTTQAIFTSYGTDSTYTTAVYTYIATLPAGVTGLRYIKVQNDNGSAGAGELIGTVDDIKFWNGVSTVSNKPTGAVSLTGCKAYYNFEQTSGNLTNIATTASGFPDAMSSIDMTSSGTVTKNSTGKVGSYAWTFDGSTGYASTTRIVAGFSKMTLSAWVYSTGGSVTDEYIFSEGKYFSNDWTVGFKRENGNLRFWVSNNGSDLNGGITSDSSFTANTWHHVVVLYDGSQSTNANKLKLYVDNTQKTLTFTIQNGFPATLRTASNNVSYIGNNDGNSNWFIGKIDDMSIWNRVLSASEISILYNSGSGSALNTQTAPETNTIAVETDTGFRKFFDGNNWLKTSDVIDTFDTSNWTLGTNMTISSSKFNFDLQQQGYISTRDLGANIVSSSKWTLRYVINFSTLTAPASSDYMMYIGLTDVATAGSGGGYRSGIFIGHDQSAGGGKTSTGISRNNQQLQGGTYATKTVDNSVTTSTDYYCVLKRTSSTAFSFTITTGGYSGTVISTGTGTATATTDLRYLTVYSDNYGTTPRWIGTIDNLEFYNGELI